MNELDTLRAAACLVHSVPGLTLHGITRAGEPLVVSRLRLDAHMDPCHFRAVVLAAGRPGWPRVHEVIASLEVVGGAVGLGGGLYQATHPAEGEARWFATFLDAAVVQQITARCPLDVDHDDVEVSIRADVELGVCAVRCAAGPAARTRLDEVATWLLSACLAEELVASIAQEVRP